MVEFGESYSRFSSKSNSSSSQETTNLCTPEITGKWACGFGTCQEGRKIEVHIITRNGVQLHIFLNAQADITWKTVSGQQNVIAHVKFTS